MITIIFRILVDIKKVHNIIIYNNVLTICNGRYYCFETWRLCSACLFSYRTIYHYSWLKLICLWKGFSIAITQHLQLNLINAPLFSFNFYNTPYRYTRIYSEAIDSQNYLGKYTSHTPISLKCATRVVLADKFINCFRTRRATVGRAFNNQTIEHLAHTEHTLRLNPHITCHP